MKKQVLVLGTLLGTLGVFSGCGLMETMPEGVPVSRGPGILDDVNDIPVPSHFVLDEDRSYSCDRFRHAPLELRSFRWFLTGQRSIPELANWYERQMPLHGWRLVSSRGGTTTVLRFESRREAAELRLSHTLGEDHRHLVTELLIDVGPKVPDEATAGTPLTFSQAAP